MNSSDFTNQYLDLIQIQNIEPPSLTFLAQLQSAHIEALAWNTIDVFLGRKASLDPQVILDKFLMERRGGLCYELNGAFCQLLQQLGFDAHLSTCFAIHYHDDPFDFPSDTHAVIIVKFEDTPYLVEVGFGDLIKQPVKIEHAFHHHDESGDYRMMFNGSLNRFQLEKLCHSEWIVQYHFELHARELSSFTSNLDVVYQHPTYQQLNYIKPGKQGTQILKQDHYIVVHQQLVEKHSFESLGGLNKILKDTLGMTEQFVSTYF